MSTNLIALSSQPGFLDPLSLENPPPERKQTLARKFKRHAFNIFVKKSKEVLKDLGFFKFKESSLYLLFYISLYILFIIFFLFFIIPSFINSLYFESYNLNNTFISF